MYTLNLKILLMPKSISPSVTVGNAVIGRGTTPVPSNFLAKLF